VEEHTVKQGAFRMTWTIDPAHGRDSDSRNVPGRRNDYVSLLSDKIDFGVKS